LSGACGCVWLCPFMPDIKWHCFLRTRLQWHLPGTRKPPSVAIMGPGCMPSRGARIRQVGLTGGKILSAHGHLCGGKEWCRLLPGLVLFRLVVPPLQPGVVGPYPVWGTWFPSHLLLEGNMS
jgi:hypothetical protein